MKVQMYTSKLADTFFIEFSDSNLVRLAKDAEERGRKGLHFDTHLDKILMFYSRHHIDFTNKTILKWNYFSWSAPPVENFDGNNLITIPGKVLDFIYVTRNTSCKTNYSYSSSVIANGTIHIIIDGKSLYPNIKIYTNIYQILRAIQKSKQFN